MTSKDEKTILKVGDTLNRKYKIEKYLGGGAFGEVYRVKNQFLKKRFAVKVFKIALDLKGNDTTAQEMLDEAVLLAKFDHRNIVKVHDADTFQSDDGQEYVFFVMDYVPGGDLDDYWKSFGSNYIPLDNVIDIIKQICKGLNVLHSENPPMIHRDIKPQNIMIGYDNQGIVAKLTDFGLVKSVNPSTLYASAKGTLAFKAPEYLKEIDNTSTDIFALGVTFYMLLTDKLPYSIDNEFDVMTGSWLKQTPKPINYYNPLINDQKLEDIVFKAISTDPKKRYNNARELLDAIVEWENLDDTDSHDDFSKDKTINEENIISQESQVTNLEENSTSSSFHDEDNSNLNNELVSNIQEPFNRQGKQSVKQEYEPRVSREDAEKEVRQAKDLSKDPHNFMYASDALANAFKHNNEVRTQHQENMEILYTENPPQEFVNKAFKAVDNLLDYEKGVDYLEQAFARKPEFKTQYNSKHELWKSFILIKNPNTIDEGIYNLKQLIQNDNSIKKDYSFAISLLSSKNAQKIEIGANHYLKRNDAKKASILIELAMLIDENIKVKYQYKLKNWKKGITA